ncbi:MAG: ROK family protein [Clostridiales bacterium]|nr:ROK family protein [Clostridiales bacterium]
MNYLGIDVGGSRIKTGVVNDAGEIIWSGSIDIPADFPAFRQAIIDLYNAKKDEYDIRGVGISSCGGINPYTGLVTPGIAPRLQYLIGKNYYDLRRDIPVPIALEKDGNCAALGEKWTGSGVELHSYCALVLGSGLGGGVIYKDKVYEGAHFLAGDVGYAFPSFDAEKGFSGLCAPVQVEQHYTELTGKKKNIAQMYDTRAEDPIAARVCGDFFNHLANTIITMQYILDPQAFLLGGGITAWDQLIPLLQETIDRQAREHGLPATPVVKRCRHMNGANLIGAVYNLKMKENL